MLDLLLKLYEHVSVWIQGKYDKEYLRFYPQFSKLSIIEGTLDAYEALLTNDDIDYVGTRLHAGIKALNMKRRSIIIAIDNRAVEIARDTNLPVIYREKVNTELEPMIKSKIKTEIELPLENIERWKRQFTG